jgi:hypothetical protein
MTIWRLMAAGALLSAAILLSSAAAGAPTRGHDSDAFSYVVRAGRTFQTLGPLELRNRKTSVTYADAIRALGRPTYCRAFQGAIALARWRNRGVRMKLATLGGLPAGKNGCTAPRSIYVSVAYASGSQWRTNRGLTIGDSAADVKAIYPRAVFQRRPDGGWPAPAYWIVHVRERCVIGLCRTRYHEVPRLTAHMRNGRVIEFFFPVGAQGE